jgi:hypothetical protein
MDIVPILISATALAVSVFTFWWTQLRQKKSFFFVRTDRLLSFETLRFALVNGGRSPQLITELHLHLEGRDKEGRFYPAAQISSPTDSGLIEPGKATEYEVRFKEKFTSSLAQSGRISKINSNFFEFFVCLDVSWVDMEGHAYTARVTHSVIGLDPTGEIRLRGPFGSENAKYELHAIAA